MENRFASVLAVLIFALVPFKLAAQNDLLTIVGPSLVCEGECFDLTAVYTGQGGGNPSGVIYTWSTADGSIVTTSNTPTITACAPGTYTVVVTSANGIATATAMQTVIAIPYQIISIVSSNPNTCTDSLDFCEKICPNTTITYSITSTGSTQPAGAGQWSVSGPGIATVAPDGRSVTVTWTAPGNGTVTVITSGFNNCPGEASLCIDILPLPIASFTTTGTAAADTLEICRGQTLWFENTSQYGSYFEWSFSDDNSQSSASNTQHTFNTSGLFAVDLVAFNSCFCADSTRTFIRVLDAEAPTLECIGTVCPGATVTYATSTPCADYDWQVSTNGSVLVGGGATEDSITIQWNSGPAGLITLGATSCTGGGNTCPLETTFLIPVIDNSAEIRGPEQVCPNETSLYSIDAFGGTGYTWTLNGGGTIQSGQGTNAVQISWSAFPSATNIYWLVVEYDNCYLGCGGRDSIPVRIVWPFGLNGPVEQCDGGSAFFTSKITYNGQNIDCNWTLEAPNGTVVWTSPAPTANPNVTFNAGPGYYQLRAVPNDPTMTCTSEATWGIQVLAAPPSPAGITGAGIVCPGVPFSYEIMGAPTDVNTHWLVQNGAGAVVADEGNPINVTWGAAGPYSLQAWFGSADALGCRSDTVQLVIQPLGSVLPDGDLIVCEDGSGTYQITNLPSGIPVNWSVTPASAGTVLSGQGSASAEIFWYEAGGHAVNADVCGQPGLIAVTVLAPPDPMVQFPAGLCAGQTATVQTSGSFSSYSWLDAAGAELSTANSLVLGAGTYSIAVTDANGCVGSADFTIADYTTPNVSITTPDPTGFCNNGSFVTLHALANSDGNLTYAWFQNGNPLAASASTYTTNQYGNYTVEVTNSFGCTATGGPIVLFNYCGGGGGGSGFPGGGGGCPPGSAAIVPAATAQCDSFVFSVAGPLYVAGSASWQFGVSGGFLLGTGAGDNVGFAFPNAGYYLAIAQVQLSNGSSCELIDSVTVDAVAQFTGAGACVGTAVVFQDESTFPPGGGISGWLWDFDDPASGGANTSTVRNASHTFAASGTFAVNLTVTANSGCTSTTTENIFISAADTAFFNDPPARCEGEALLFTSVQTPGMVSVVWDFGDPTSGSANSSTGDSVYHTYTAAGVYTVTTTATQSNGCTALYSRTITVAGNALSGVISPSGVQSLCEGQSITLTAPAGGVAYLWSDSTTTTTTFTTMTEGSYTVTVVDADGCRFTPPAVEVNQVPGPDAIIKALIKNEYGQVIGVEYPSLSACEGDDVFLLAETPGGLYTYTWSNGSGGNTLEFSEIRFNQLTTGTYVYNVTVTESSTGCTAVPVPFTVVINPVPDGFSIDGSGFCAGNLNTLTYTGPTPGNWQYLWSNGVSGTTMETDEPGIYTLQVVNEFGCSATSNAFTVLPGPFISAVPAGCHTRCSPDTLCLPTIPDITSWQWFFNGMPVPGATSPDFIAQQSGSYWAELTDVYGCTRQTDPLDLQLLAGFGNILGQVWMDVNDNGLIDGPDTLVSGIDVLLKQGFTTVGANTSNAMGAYAFTNVPTATYAVQIDAANLPSQWEIVIGQALANVSGCGTEYNTGLLIKPFDCQDVNVTVQLSTCAGDSVLYNGVYIQAGSSEVFPLTTYLGCDSTVTVSVAPLPPSGSAITTSICDNETYLYNGNALLPGSTNSFVFQNAQGCDSTVAVTVLSLNTFELFLDLSACEGETVVYDGNNILAGQSVDLTYQTIDGCDSVIHVTVLSLPLGPDTQLGFSVCPGETYDYQGNLLPAGTVQDFIYPNILGCDSVVTVTVTALQTSATLLEPALCPGETYTHEGNVLQPGQSAQFTYTNFAGCDSVLTINTIALPQPATLLEPGVCPGETYTYDGVVLNAGDQQDFTYTSWQGCDSIVTVTVIGLVSTASTLQAGACPGTSFIYNGVNIPAGATQNFTLTNIAGCDSVVTVVVNTLNTAAETLSVEVCPDESFTINGITIPAGSSQVLMLQTWQGCDSVLTVNVASYPAVQFDVETELSCPNTPNGTLLVTGASGGLLPYRYSIDGSVFQDDSLFTSLQPGEYTVYLEDSHACVYEVPAEIDARAPLSVFLANGILPCDSSGVVMVPEIQGDPTDLTYLWFDGSTDPTYTAGEAGQVYVDVTNVCETQSAVAQVFWAELENNGSLVYVPNVFAPLSIDYDNSRFKSYFASGLTIFDYQFSIFDRWGNLMFQTEDVEGAWDGVFRGEDMMPGVYVYIIKVRLGICGRIMDITKEGDVTIVK
ncbi:MAG: PKD domain-containing protein [Saprospiraceae bacterium]|nr:PKD domain-containing protein [Saprospiraceae bacterium]